MGFFAWIREGVRQAVLMGVSDAVTEIGNRRSDEDLGEHLATTLRQALPLDPEAKSASAAAVAGASAGPGRKRLGKSLEQIRESHRA
jgi:hypothetical protein